MKRIRTKRALIGFSLSSCVFDILLGNVDIAEVQAIVAGTMFDSPEHAVEIYGKSTWAKFPKEECLKCVQHLWTITLQPRLVGNAPFYHNFPWVDIANGEFYKLGELTIKNK